VNLIWDVSADDASRVRTFLAKHGQTKFMKDREARNLRSDKPELTRDEVWTVLVGCLLTTQQRSGPASHVSRILDERPFPLSYERCREQPRAAKFCREVLTKSGGIRRAPTIGDEIEKNLRLLESRLWPALMRELNQLRAATTPSEEREVARYIARNFDGFGPKQSRNMIQWLGLSRYETPIDSRVTKWLNEFGFPIHLSAAPLSDEDYYCFVGDGFQALCAKASVYPCMLDAAIFESFDVSD
jgi:hypothetical protein